MKQLICKRKTVAKTWEEYWIERLGEDIVSKLILAYGDEKHD